MHCSDFNEDVIKNVIYVQIIFAKVGLCKFVSFSKGGPDEYAPDFERSQIRHPCYLSVPL